MIFANRVEAGRRLAAELHELRGRDVVVLGLPRGGVPVAAEVASALRAPLDVTVVRKLGVPYRPEVAMGAIAEDGARVLNEDVLRTAGVDEDRLAAVEAAERAELDRRAREYRGGRSPVAVAGRTAVIVDDGIATGATARAACRAARTRGARRIVLAVPVAPPGWEGRVGTDADAFVCPETPPEFMAVGQFYRDFPQTSDAEVVERLRHGSTREVTVPVGDGSTLLPGELTLPEGASGVVLFAHGAGSGRLSPRNRFVADSLNAVGLGTLLFDLLTEEEAEDRANVFDVGLLAARLTDATAWLDTPLPLGYFGASTGAAAALWAAAEPGARIGAVVSRGGRPDLADQRLPEVTAPTLLIVGGGDPQVLELNREAQQAMRAAPGTRLSVVPGATHLFPEPGALSEVAELARDWFLTHLAGAAPAAEAA
ncbi:phosphoribosyltransferase family protein [Streptomyces sp. DSM 44917]|uniref:Phosphoribosyltransferase family protein n=1 Tax=Streptomyces boetiae TaxID=3075541 RepID=A0ABU2L9S6_9ACTN|nr:phosphoribosyltransferase family protein [Streptomyces sp. DSM 44917]MDT0308331.1 phosphoribosyltransferase family protein [Streptomyces sp. DSM 44917]